MRSYALAIAKKLKDKYQYKQNKDAVAGIIGPIGATTNMCDLNNVYQMSADGINVNLILNAVSPRFGARCSSLYFNFLRFTTTVVKILA